MSNILGLCEYISLPWRTPDNIVQINILESQIGRPAHDSVARRRRRNGKNPPFFSISSYLEWSFFSSSEAMVGEDRSARRPTHPSCHQTFYRSNTHCVGNSCMYQLRLTFSVYCLTYLFVMTSSFRNRSNNSTIWLCNFLLLYTPTMPIRYFILNIDLIPHLLRTFSHSPFSMFFCIF